MKALAPIRAALGIRTVFNLLGPLTNPAAPRFLLIGAYDAATAELMAGTLAGMQIERALGGARRRGLGRSDADRPIPGIRCRGQTNPATAKSIPRSLASRAAARASFSAATPGRISRPCSMCSKDAIAARIATRWRCNVASRLMIAGRAQSIAAGIDAARARRRQRPGASMAASGCSDFAANRSGTQGRP